MPIKPTSPLSMREIIKTIYFTLAPKGSRLYSVTHTLIRQLLNSRYKFWIKHFDRYSQEDFQRIKEETEKLSVKPMLSVIMPVFNPDLDFLKQAIKSVQDQVYPYWELCIADDASTKPGVKETIQEFCSTDQRIKTIFRTNNGHISAASNSALSLSSGGYIALLDHDDMLHPLALYHVAKEINAHPECAVIYSDEDKITPNGKRIDPYFKSDFDYDLFLSQNMVSHLGVYQRELINKIGGFRQGVEGSQDYDLLLRLLPLIEFSQIRHIPKVLYHWRISAHSVADSIDIKPYALEAGKQALSDFLAQKNIQADVNTFENFGYKIKYVPPRPKPEVELIFIDQGSNQQFPENCGTLIEQALVDYSPITLNILSNEDKRDSINAFLRKRLPNLKITVNCLDEKLPFQIEQHINESSAEYVVMVEDACLQSNPGWLSNLISLASQPGVGCVSPKLVDKKGFIYSCGLILTNQFFAQRLFFRVSDAQINHYFGWSSLHKGYSVLPSACLVFAKAHFLSVGGLDAKLSDHTARCFDLCLKMREKGLRNVIMPETTMVLERTIDSRREQTAELIIRNEADRYRLHQRYTQWFEDDPAFNPNLTVLKGKPIVSKAPRKLI
jgi:glycosyltransferase involved in cell wall biosynthesis